jgi:hypothetical protein
LWSSITWPWVSAPDVSFVVTPPSALLMAMPPMFRLMFIA